MVSFIIPELNFFVHNIKKGFPKNGRSYNCASLASLFDILCENGDQAKNIKKVKSEFCGIKPKVYNR